VSNGAQTRAGWLAVSPAILWTILFFIVPFVGMVLTSLWPQGVGHWSVADYAQFFANDAYWRAMTNSLEVTGLVTVFSVLLAYPFAWILAFVVSERWQRLALMFAVLPFWTSYVVRSYAWLLVLSEKGVINSALVNIGILSQPVQLANTRFATVTGFVHFFVMLLTLTIYANLKQLSPNYRKAATDLGASSLQTFLHVILPLTLHHPTNLGRQQ
jgi:spermidine/putrescine transport system permease protein